MASTADKSERDQDERDDEREDEDERDDEREDEDERDDEGDDARTSAKDESSEDAGDDDEDEEEAAEKPKPKAAAKASREPERPHKSSKSSKALGAKAKASKPEHTAAAPSASDRPTSGAAGGGTLGKSLVLFVIVVGGLAAGFALLGREEGGGAPPVPKWKTGQVVDVELTLVPSDNKDLACAAAQDVAGRHCEFEDRGKRWSKGGESDDAHVLKPYTTTDRLQFLAAGVWDQPATKGKLPNTRFSLKCKYKVEGKVPKPIVRWSSDGPWFDRPDDWFAGIVSDCAIVP